MVTLNAAGALLRERALRRLDRLVREHAGRVVPRRNRGCVRTHGHRLDAPARSRTAGTVVTPRRSFDAAADAGAIDDDLVGRLAPSTGLRNVLVHAYVDLDLDRVAAAVPFAIDGYGEYVRQVAGWLRERPELGSPTSGDAG